MCLGNQAILNLATQYPKFQNLVADRTRRRRTPTLAGANQTTSPESREAEPHAGLRVTTAILKPYQELGLIVQHQVKHPQEPDLDTRAQTSYPSPTMAHLETIQLEHLPAGYTIHVALYRDIKNAAFLHQQLLAGNTSFEYALIDASIVSLPLPINAPRTICAFLPPQILYSSRVFFLNPTNPPYRLYPKSTP